MAPRHDVRRRLIRWGTGATTAGLLVFSSGIAAFGVDQNIIAPETAAILWIDIEDTVLRADQITGEIVVGDVVQHLDFHSSPTGLTAVLDNFPSEFGVRLSVSEATLARVAVTFATSDRDIVSETNSIIELPRTEQTDDGEASPEAKPTPDDSDPNGSADDEDKPSTDSGATESPSSSSGSGSDDDGDSDNEHKPSAGAGDGNDGSKPSAGSGSGDVDKDKTAVTGASVGWAVGSAAVLLTAGIGLLIVRKRGAHTNG